jgi:hypothetical protein
VAGHHLVAGHELIRTLVHARADRLPNPRVARRYRNLLLDNRLTAAESRRDRGE